MGSHKDRERKKDDHPISIRFLNPILLRSHPFPILSRFSALEANPVFIPLDMW